MLPFALLELGIVLVLVPRLRIPPRGALQRVQGVSICVVLIATTLGIVFAQIQGFCRITSRRDALDDTFVATILILENLLSLFLTIVILKRKGGIFSKDTSSGVRTVPLPQHLAQISYTARSEFISQLDSSERHGVRVFWVGWAICMLLIWPVVIYSYVFARGHSRRASLTFDALACGIALLSLGCFYLVMRRTATKYAPACSSCGRKITWREKNNVLDSGRCPYCNAEMFKAV
jgi:hypothetical protein